LAIAGTTIGLADNSPAAGSPKPELPVLLLAAGGAAPDSGGNAASPRGAASLPVLFRLEDGTFDVVRDGVTVFSRATADALIVGPGDKPRRTVSFADPGQRSQDDAGVFVCRTGDAELRLKFAWFGEDRRRFTVRLTVQNRADAPIVVLKAAPLDYDRGIRAAQNPSHPRERPLRHV
jgi:hypothetical protein